MALLLLAALLASASAAPLRPNAPGRPQELRHSTAVCANRSAICSVLLDVPAACVARAAGGGSGSACPIAFFLHGHGGLATEFVEGRFGAAAQGVHAHGYIGVYPQGEVTDVNQTASCRANLTADKEVHCGTGWNDGSMSANRCEWNGARCSCCCCSCCCCSC